MEDVSRGEGTFLNDLNKCFVKKGEEHKRRDSKPYEMVAKRR